MPKPYHPHIASHAAADIAHRALRIDWFSSVGRLAPAPAGIRWVMTWADAITLLTSEAWSDYLLDAQNDMIDPVPRPQCDDWKWAVDQVDLILGPRLPQTLRAEIPATGKTLDDAVECLIRNVRLAAVEAHFAQWISKPFFGPLFAWLELGRLPCGATGDFPSTPLLVF